MQKISIVRQIVAEILAQLCFDDSIQILRDNLPHNASFWQVDLLDVVPSEYRDKCHNFKSLIFCDITLLKSIV